MRFKFLDVIGFLPLVLNIADGFPHCGDHRSHSEIGRLRRAGPLFAKKQIALNPGHLTSRTLMAHTD
jgi:hypothetical protein